MPVDYVSGVFGCRVVILDQSLHGALLNGAEFHAQALGSLLDFATEGVGDRAYAVDGEPRTTVLLDVAYEEVHEALYQQAVYLGYLTMLREEGGEAGKESVCQGLAIYLLEDDLLGEFIFTEELFAQCFGELILEAVTYEAAT